MRFAACAALLLFACSSGDVAPRGGETGATPDAGVSGPKAEGEPCAAAIDCVVGLACTGGKCAKDTSGFCNPCTIDQTAAICPGAGTNFCLTETVDGHNSEFCGKDCSDGSECPSGSSCNGILRPRGETCSTTEACPASDKACTADGDCPGGACDKAAGKCRATCVGASGNANGSCGCVVDADCPADSCDLAAGRCHISSRPCDASKPCTPLACEQHANAAGGTTGYCRVGKNCAPAGGLTCADFRH